MNAVLNKKNNRLIVAVAALVLLVAGIAVVATAEDSNAATYADKSPLSFSADINYGESYGTTSNADLNNSISVSYNSTTGTFTFNGYLAEQDLADTTSAFYKLWTDNTDCKYGVAFTINDSTNPTVKVGSTGKEVTMTDGVEECLLYLDGQTKTTTVKIGDVTYTLDFSNINYLTSADIEGKQIIDGRDVNAENSTINLSSDAYLVSTITATTGNIVINLNGYDLMTGGRLLNADTNNDSTTVSLTINAGEGGSISAAYDIVYANSTGKLTVNGGSYTSGDYAFVWGGVTVDENSTTSAEFKDATINGHVGIWLSYGTFNNATIENCEINAVLGLYLATFNDGEGQGATVKNTTVNATETAVEIKSGNVTIENCTLSSETYQAHDGLIGMSESGSGINTVCINNGYTSSGSADGVNVTINDSTITNSATDMPVQVLAGNKKSGSTYVACTGNIKLTSNCIDESQVVLGYTAESIEANNSITLNLSDGKVSTVTTADEIKSNADSGGTIIVAQDVTTTEAVTLSNKTDMVIGKDITYSGPVTVGATEAFIVNGGTYSGTVTTTDGKETNTAVITSVKGNYTITLGSIVMGGTVIEDGNSTVAINGTSSVKDSFTLGADVGMTISGGILTIPAGATLTINGDLTVNDGAGIVNNGTMVVNTGATFAMNGTFSGNAISCAVEITGTNKDQVKLTQAAGDDNLGLKGTLEADYTVTNLNYLSDNLVIKEGVTLTIASKGTFDLGQYNLTVNGNLVIERNGNVISAQGGEILLGAKGTIQNSGVIGADSNVTVGVDTNLQNPAGEVTLMNVTGMTFGITKEVSGQNVTNTLTVGGSVTAKGDNPAVVIDNAYITGEFKVNNLTMTIGANGVKVLRNATFDIQSKAVVTGGAVELAENGATVVINGTATVSIVAMTGEYKADVTNPSLTATTIDVDKAKGLTVTTGQYTYVDDSGETEVTMIVKTMVVSGTLAEVSKGANASVGISAANAAYGNVGVTVSGTLNVDETVGFSTTAKIYVTGTIVSDVDLTTANAAYINGTAYYVQTTDSTGATDETHYITTFENAFGQIANAYDHEITVYGDLEVSNEITIAAENSVVIANGTLTIAETGRVNVQEEGAISGVVNVYGIMYCAAYSSYDDPAVYAAMSEDDDGNVTFAGLRAAIANAKEGDTVTITQTTDVDESLTVPAGITLQVNEGVTLTFDKDLTIQEGAKVVNQGIINMSGTSKLTVYGELDSTEGDVNGAAATAPATGNTAVYSTGTTTLAAAIDNATINAAYYTDDDGNIVVTSAAKAAAAVAQMDVNKVMHLSGTFSESGDFTADGITVTVDKGAKVSLGTVTLDDAKIGFEAVTGQETAGVLTATITAQTGADGSTAASTVAVSEINGVTIESADRIGSDNVTYWYLYLNGATPAGKYTVSAGTVTLGTTTTGTVEFKGDSTLTVSAGATVVVPAVTTLTVGAATNADNAAVTVEGTLAVVGTVDVTGYMYVTGTIDIEGTQSSDAAIVDVKGTGVLQVAGTVNVSEEQDVEGTLQVAGALVLGDAPTTLGATGTVNGPVDFTDSEDGYVKAYAGSTIDAAKLDLNGVTESNAVSTVFHINGTLYMTVYTAKTGGATFDAVLKAEDFEIVGYDTSGANNYIMNGNAATEDYAWYAKADYSGSPTDKDTKIGAEGYENVYFQASIVEKPFTVSVGPGISLYVDGVRITQPTIMLGIGTYTVEAIVDPGYTGTTSITFNGQAVTGNTITVTADMISDAYQGSLTIAASGAISQDSTVVVDGGSTGDSGMGLTDYLLIILVILIVVMAIMVAMRLMRS